MKFQKAAVIIFFLLTLITGALVFDDYAIPWDEPIQRELGNASLGYVLHGDDSLFRMINKYHGSVIEMLEQQPERILNLENPGVVYLWRHAINYFLFWLGSIFLFLLALKLFRNNWYALITVLMLYLTPRIFAHAFFNSKDIPLMVFFIISMYFLMLLIEEPTYLKATLIAFTGAVAFDIRVLGILIPVIVFLAMVVLVARGTQPLLILRYFLIFLVVFIATAYMFYPVMWKDPLKEIVNSFRVMSHYPFDDPQLFMGKLTVPSQLPWYYLPVWMAITIPIAWQICFLSGCLALTLMIIKNMKIIFTNYLGWLIIVSWLFIPIITILMIKAVVYDEWRHLFFVYPAFLLIAVYGISVLWNQLPLLPSKNLAAVGRCLVITMLAMQSISIGIFQIRNHPFEHVYFNSLAGSEIEQKYDLDYWGLSYRQGLKYMAEYLKHDSLRVCWSNAPGSYNLIWLTDSDQKRMIETGWDSCEYFITNYRYHPEIYLNHQDENIYSIKVDGITILSVFRRKNSE